MKDNTKRFSDRVDNYSKYRPSYPRELTDHLCDAFGVSRWSTVTDVGSGTGIFSELIADKVGTLYGLEPNDEMRKCAETRLKEKPSFISLCGTAEYTTLADRSTDFITVAQAFHWFDREKTKAEFKRILKPDGTVFLIFNKRQLNTPFLKKYEAIIQNNIPEYKEVNHHNITKEMIQAFFDRDYAEKNFNNGQVFDWNGLMGRFSSSSYTPLPGTSEYESIRNKLKDLFDTYSENGKIQFNYETELYSGKFT